VSRSAASSPRRFLGWDTVVGGATLQTLHTALFFASFGVYVVAWNEDLGWSRTATSTGFAIATIVGGALSILIGRLLDRVGVRRVVAAGLAGFIVALLSLSFATTIVHFYLAMAAWGLAIAMSGFLSITTAVVPWFAARRSTAIALMTLGVSIGGLFVPLIADAVLAWGWRTTLRAEALLLAVLIVPIIILMRKPPEAYGQEPDGPGATRAKVGGGSAAGESLTLAAALRTRAFWLLAVGHASALVLVNAVNVHLVPALVEGGSFDLARAARVVTVMTLVTGVGQLMGGPIGDRFDKRKVATIAMWTHAMAFALLAVEANLWTGFAFAGLHGFAWGVRGPLMTSLRADYFGAKYFASIMGVTMTILMAGQLAGPIVAGFLADLTGSYQPAFFTLAVFGAVASFAYWFARPPTVRSGAEIEASTQASG